MQALANKRILLGVTGGIAAYKAADLCRRLRAAGAEVQVVMTRGAAEFITPMTLQAVSGKRVRSELFDVEAEAGMGHIELARWADAVLIAPASASFIARLTHGLADDLLATICLATESPLLLAPAMNRVMWDNPATQANVTTLQDRGVAMLGPGVGDQACGEEGAGRLLEPVELVEHVVQAFKSAVLAGRHVVVTAGPTREALDPVRYLSNHSSGRMGFAVARAAAEAGACVTLISGPVTLSTPAGVERVDVTSAADMEAAVNRVIDDADIFIATAAVADYRSAQPAAQKMKKSTDGLILSLEKTPDILGQVAERRPDVFTVGFAAETEQLETYARAKLTRKRLDLVAANQVGDGLGFGVEDNALSVYWADGSRELERAPKEQLARALITLIVERFYAQHPDQDSQSAAR
ncbi:phosphopantothenoylcysteine decarboxylase/phosphopantothenate--cysteine ligase [Methylohalomonas lacus]|uniref:Coenzyme A biosynthesis bifunctional protein CoaBC n=1 Tax=Methylohalomonas lacus TaxID=398773 RepID=A0AAE3HJ13_9GAMM|nr:bifunctional phosphopantothenoylcysteine decarboxylase/phosphopantothenate--cysteine ligase CoaBC [Methylohalomonas lacus]MCS3903276.1 phosphopantothenoylcysteine decarboxylase/phosphopantothenate--cysteine ligase [Methylohalomonas lacus]